MGHEGLLISLTHSDIYVHSVGGGGGGLWEPGYGPNIIQDGMVKEVDKKLVFKEIQGVREGLLQEERTADALGFRCRDGLCAGIRPEITQPVHTGEDG